MGLLDDAIREHLELKRQHGADEGELRRKQEEALGPARREADPAPEPPDDDDVAGYADTAEAPPDFAAEDEPFAAEDPPDFSADDEPFADAPPARTEAAETVEADALEGDEDVLEETPDFLQETPEHDRLWFEQKPPRDFDFDDDK